MEGGGEGAVRFGESFVHADEHIMFACVIRISFYWILL